MDPWLATGRSDTRQLGGEVDGAVVAAHGRLGAQLRGAVDVDHELETQPLPSNYLSGTSENRADWGRAGLGDSVLARAVEIPERA